MRRYWSDRTRHYAYPVFGALRAIDDERKQLAAALYITRDGRLLEPRHECVMPVRAERMTVRKPVTRDLGTGNEQHDTFLP